MVVSIGVSADWQRDLVVTWAAPVAGEPRRIGRKQDYLALAVDVFVDLPVREDGLVAVTGQVDAYRYDFGRDLPPSAGLASAARFWPAGQKEYSGVGALAELGVRYAAYGAVVGADWFDAAGAVGDEGDLFACFGGPVWWVAGHEANLKLQVGLSRAGYAEPGRDEWIFGSSLQTQMLF